MKEARTQSTDGEGSNNLPTIIRQQIFIQFGEKRLSKLTINTYIPLYANLKHPHWVQESPSVLKFSFKVIKNWIP